MDSKTMLIAFLVIIILMLWFSLKNLEGKIKCVFHTKDRTVEEKTLKTTDKMVKFSQGTYEINPRRFSIKWIRLWSVFSFPMLYQEWKWDSSQPLDPSTFKNSWDTPEARNASDSEREWRGFNQGIDTQLGKKQSGLERWLPYITIGVVVIGLFFLYSTFNGKLGILEQQLQNLAAMYKAGK